MKGRDHVYCKLQIPGSYTSSCRLTGMARLFLVALRYLIVGLAIALPLEKGPLAQAASSASSANITATLSNSDLISVANSTTQILSVAAENLGGAAMITASADPINLDLPVAVSICQLGTGGTCIAPLSHSVVSAMGSNQTA